MAEDRCKHDLILGQCADCAPLPAGLPRRVYRTAGGDVFHRTPACEAWHEGQRKAARQGLRNHPPQAVDIVAAKADGLGACEACLPDYRSESATPKPCNVYVDGHWVSGKLLRWQRSSDQRWEGLVTYAVDREVFTTVKDQADLQPRG
jgi:hypothetical protein